MVITSHLRDSKNYGEHQIALMINYESPGPIQFTQRSK